MRSDKIPLPAANLIIIDEAHHVAARTWAKILQAYPNARLIGLTATPCRADGRGLGNFFDVIIIGPQIAELIECKYLVKTIYYAPADPDLKGVETRQGDYVINQLADRMNRDDLVGDIVSNWHKLAQRRRTIVFCVDVAHSIHVRNEFINSGVKSEHVDGSTPKADRDAILGRLASGETEVVANCMVLTEGFDARPSDASFSPDQQSSLDCFGKWLVVDCDPAEGKHNLILIDHSGAVYRHGLLEDPVEWTLDTTRRAENPTHAARDRQMTSRLVECSKCGALRTGGEACPHCGFLPKRRPDAIIFADGEFARVDRDGRPIQSSDPHERMRWHAMLTFIAAARHYKPGWAAHKYKEKFGSWPPRPAPPPIEPNREVLSWVRCRIIAYAKAQQKASAA